MLKQRVITGVFGLIVLLGILFFLPQEVFRLILALVFTFAGWEWARMVNSASIFSQVIFVFLLMISILFIQSYEPSFIQIQAILASSILWWIICLLCLFAYPISFGNIFSWLFGLISLSSSYIAMDWLFIQSVSYFLVFLVFIWVMDIGAFFIGKRFGRVKLANSISPNKTWEGLFGGLVSMTILSVLFSQVYGIDKTVMIPFILALGLLSVVGDLTISMFKRNAGLKDSGRLFPGHGGLLDRIDSIISSISLYALACSIYFKY